MLTCSGGNWRRIQAFSIRHDTEGYLIVLHPVIRSIKSTILIPHTIDLSNYSRHASLLIPCSAWNAISNHSTASWFKMGKCDFTRNVSTLMEHTLYLAPTREHLCKHTGCRWTCRQKLVEDQRGFLPAGRLAPTTRTFKQRLKISYFRLVYNTGWLKSLDRHCMTVYVTTNKTFISCTTPPITCIWPDHFYWLALVYAVVSTNKQRSEEVNLCARCMCFFDFNDFLYRKYLWLNESQILIIL